MPTPAQKAETQIQQEQKALDEAIVSLAAKLKKPELVDKAKDECAELYACVEDDTKPLTQIKEDLFLRLIRYARERQGNYQEAVEQLLFEEAPMSNSAENVQADWLTRTLKDKDITELCHAAGISSVGVRSIADLSSEEKKTVAGFLQSPRGQQFAENTKLYTVSAAPSGVSSSSSVSISTTTTEENTSTAAATAPSATAAANTPAVDAASSGTDAAESSPFNWANTIKDTLVNMAAVSFMPVARDSAYYPAWVSETYKNSGIRENTQQIQRDDLDKFFVNLESLADSNKLPGFTRDFIENNRGLLSNLFWLNTPEVRKNIRAQLGTSADGFFDAIDRLVSPRGSRSSLYASMSNRMYSKGANEQAYRAMLELTSDDWNKDVPATNSSRVSALEFLRKQYGYNFMQVAQLKDAKSEKEIAEEFLETPGNNTALAHFFEAYNKTNDTALTVKDNGTDWLINHQADLNEYEATELAKGYKSYRDAQVKPYEDRWRAENKYLNTSTRSLRAAGIAAGELLSPSAYKKWIETHGDGNKDAATTELGAYMLPVLANYALEQGDVERAAYEATYQITAAQQSNLSLEELTQMRSVIGNTLGPEYAFASSAASAGYMTYYQSLKDAGVPVSERRRVEIAQQTGDIMKSAQSMMLVHFMNDANLTSDSLKVLQTKLKEGEALTTAENATLRRWFENPDAYVQDYVKDTQRDMTSVYSELTPANMANYLDRLDPAQQANVLNLVRKQHKEYIARQDATEATVKPILHGLGAEDKKRLGLTAANEAAFAKQLSFIHQNGGDIVQALTGNLSEESVNYLTEVLHAQERPAFSTFLKERKASRNQAIKALEAEHAEDWDTYAPDKKEQLIQGYLSAAETVFTAVTDETYNAMNAQERTAAIQTTKTTAMLAADTDKKTKDVYNKQKNPVSIADVLKEPYLLGAWLMNPDIDLTSLKANSKQLTDLVDPWLPDWLTSWMNGSGTQADTPKPKATPAGEEVPVAGSADAGSSAASTSVVSSQNIALNATTVADLSAQIAEATFNKFKDRLPEVVSA